MIVKRALVVASILMMGLATGASAGITCTVTDEPNGRISVVVTTDAEPLLESLVVIETEVILDLFTCLNSTLPANSCTFKAKGSGPSAEVEVQFRDSLSDGFLSCGSFTNADGLPVELVEFSVE